MTRRRYGERESHLAAHIYFSVLRVILSKCVTLSALVQNAILLSPEKVSDCARLRDGGDHFGTCGSS